MTQEEINEGNKLIAGFMGGHENPQHKWYNVIQGDKGYRMIQDFKFHSSWDWIMPVVEKIHINKLVTEVSIRPGRTRIWLKSSFIQSPMKAENNSITECWLVVVDFIKWHNEQNS